MIVLVSGILNRLMLTVSDILIHCAVVIFRVKESFLTSVDGINIQLMNEAEYLMKNYGDRGGTPSEISIILHMIRKPNSIIVLLFIQKNS